MSNESRQEAMAKGLAMACVGNSETLTQFSQSMGRAIDAKDSFTHSHSRQVADMSEAMAWAMGVPAREVRFINMAAHLHDIGKIGVPDAVLSKPAPLDEAEQTIVHSHPEQGAAILRPVSAFSEPGSVADMVLSHHERWDGSGYPHGIKGTEIPLGARIIAIADSMSAMMQDRPYRAGRPFDEAADEIIRLSGRAYDPTLVSVFNDIRDVIKATMDWSANTLYAMAANDE